jgi:hypothetical protein
MSTCMCSVVPTIPISLPKPLTNWHLSPPDVFSIDTPLITKALNLTSNNIVISQHVVFDEVYFPFSALCRLPNNLDIFL